MWCLVSIYCLLIPGAMAPPDKPKVGAFPRGRCGTSSGPRTAISPSPCRRSRPWKRGMSRAPRGCWRSSLIPACSRASLPDPANPVSAVDRPAQVIAELAHLRKRDFKENSRLVNETKIVVDGVIGDDFTYTVPSPRGRWRDDLQDEAFPDEPLLLRADRHLTSRQTPPRRCSPVSIDAHFRSRGRSALCSNEGGIADIGQSPAQAPRGRNQPKGDARGPNAKVKLADSTPEDALKTFLEALAAQDEETLRAVTLPDKDFAWLLKGGPAPAEVLARMKSWLEAKPMRRLKAGDPVRMPGGESGRFSPTTSVRDAWCSGQRGAPLPSRIEKVGGHWKVFARPFIAARQAAEAKSRQVRPKSFGQPRGPG